MASIETITCPTDCTAILPTVSFSQCAPALLQAQVSVIYLSNDGYALTDWTNPEEWASRISASGSNANAIRELTVIGSIAAPTQTEKKISGQRRVYSPQEFVLAATVDDNSDTNYEAARATGCNRQYRMWYGTLGGKLYGGNAGILVNWRGWEEIAESDDDYAILKLEMKWKSQFAPLRIDNPMA